MSDQPELKKGKLVIVGSGIKGLSQMTLEAKGWIEKADVLYYLVAEPVTQAWIKRIRKDAINLHHLYSGKKLRIDTYHEMRDMIMNSVRQGLRVCAVFYGHPGVFADPPHAALRMARKEGYEAEMLPGISAEDCLFADLGIDPSTHGLQSYEATELLIKNHQLYTGTHVIIWQVAIVGDPGFDPTGVFANKKTNVLAEYLEKIYGPDYYVYDYLGTSFAHVKSQIYKIKVSDIYEHVFHVNSTLYIPPKVHHLNNEMIDRLKIPLERPKDSADVTSYVEKRLPEAKSDSELAKVLSAIAFDPTLLSDFLADPNGFCKAHSFQLSTAEIEALKSNNAESTLAEMLGY